MDKDFGIDLAWATLAFDHAMITSTRPKIRFITNNSTRDAMYFLSYLFQDRLMEMLLLKGPFGPGRSDGEDIVCVDDSGDDENKTKKSFTLELICTSMC